jgi:hypothetical protein
MTSLQKDEGGTWSDLDDPRQGADPDLKPGSAIATAAIPGGV